MLEVFLQSGAVSFFFFPGSSPWKVPSIKWMLDAIWQSATHCPWSGTVFLLVALICLCASGNSFISPKFFSFYSPFFFPSFFSFFGIAFIFYWCNDTEADRWRSKYCFLINYLWTRVQLWHQCLEWKVSLIRETEWPFLFLWCLRGIMFLLQSPNF